MTTKRWKRNPLRVLSATQRAYVAGLIDLSAVIRWRTNGRSLTLRLIVTLYFSEEEVCVYLLEHVGGYAVTPNRGWAIYGRDAKNLIAQCAEYLRHRRIP